MSAHHVHRFLAVANGCAAVVSAVMAWVSRRAVR